MSLLTQSVYLLSICCFCYQLKDSNACVPSMCVIPFMFEDFRIVFFECTSSPSIVMSFCKRCFSSILPTLRILLCSTCCLWSFDYTEEVLNLIVQAHRALIASTYSCASRWCQYRRAQCSYLFLIMKVIDTLLPITCL